MRLHGQRLGACLGFALLSLTSAYSAQLPGQEARPATLTLRSGATHSVTNLVWVPTMLSASSFDLLDGSSPRRWFRIDGTRIVRVEFSTGRDVNLVVTLDDGSVVSGVLAPQDEKVTGLKGKVLGSDATVDLDNIQKLEFARPDTRSALPARGASGPAASNRHACSPSPQKWTVVDGEATRVVEDLQIVDYYSDNLKGFVVHFGAQFIRYQIACNLEVHSDGLKFAIPLADVMTLDITGRQRDDLPEVQVRKTDGSQISGLLRLLHDRSFSIGGSRPTDRTAGFGSFDVLAWRTPHGLEGVSFLPARRLVIARGETK